MQSQLSIGNRIGDIAWYLKFLGFVEVAALLSYSKLAHRLRHAND